MHCKDTILRTQNNWPYSKLIPNSGKNIPISVISEGMGHDSEATTQIYLASLDNSVVDKANLSILREL